MADLPVPSVGYRNPILPGFNPDPSILFHEGHYFIVTSSFEYFPGVPIYHSTDLIQWKLIGHVLSRRSQLDLRTCEPSGGIFAPTLRFNRHDGKFYVTVCALHRMKSSIPGDAAIEPTGFFVCTSDIWSNDWSDPVYYDQLGIDQDLCFADDGSVYLTVARSYPSTSPRFNLACHCTRIDLKSGKSLQPAEIICRSSTGRPIAEGPHIFQKDGYFYLIVAEGGTELLHQEWIYRSKGTPFGPWETAPSSTEGDKLAVNPLIFNDHHHEIRQTGHMDLCEGPEGQWWAVFLGVRPQWAQSGDCVVSQLGRETFLCPVEWRIDGWPIVNAGEKVAINATPSAGLARLCQNYSVEYEFGKGKDLYLDGWYHLRTPLQQEISLDHKPGALTLWGGPHSLMDSEAATVLLVRQQSFTATWDVDLEFQPAHVDEQAGTAIWWNQWNSARLSIRGSVVEANLDATGNTHKATKSVLVLTTPIPDTFRHEVGHPLNGTLAKKAVLFQEVATVNLPATLSRVHLRILAGPTYYRFYWGASSVNGNSDDKSNHLDFLGDIPSSSITKENPIPWVFTGAHFAIFACGALHQPCFAPATFSNIKMTGVREGGP